MQVMVCIGNYNGFHVSLCSFFIMTVKLQIKLSTRLRQMLSWKQRLCSGLLIMIYRAQKGFLCLFNLSAHYKSLYSIEWKHAYFLNLQFSQSFAVFVGVLFEWYVKCI